MTDHARPHLYEAGTVREKPLVDGKHVDRADLDDREALPPVDFDKILGEARAEQLRHYYALAVRVFAGLAAAYIAVREAGLL